MREKIVCLRWVPAYPKFFLVHAAVLWAKHWHACNCRCTFEASHGHFLSWVNTLSWDTRWKKIAFRWFWKQYLTETIYPVLCSKYQYTLVFYKHSWKIKRVVIWLYINLSLAVAARVMKDMCQALRLIYLLLICPESVSGCCVSTCFHSATRIPILARSMKLLCKIDVCIWLTIGAW